MTTTPIETQVTDTRSTSRTDLSSTTIAATLVGATALLVSGWVHFYLYFRGGYRGIAIDSVLGVNISRSFAINAIAAVVIAEALLLGFKETATTTEAVIAMVAEAIAIVALVPVVLKALRARRRPAR